MRKDRGTGMCNTSESAWVMWAKLSVGWLLWEEGWCLCCSEGTCHLTCLQLLSVVPENISSSPGTNPCPHDPSQTQADSELPGTGSSSLYLGVPQTPILPHAESGCVQGMGLVFDQFPALLL